MVIPNPYTNLATRQIRLTPLERSKVLDFDSDTDSEQIPETDTPKEHELVPEAVPETVPDIPKEPELVPEAVPEPETPKEPEEDLEEIQVEDKLKKNIGYYEWFKSFFF